MEYILYKIVTAIKTHNIVANIISSFNTHCHTPKSYY